MLVKDHDLRGGGTGGGDLGLPAPKLLLLGIIAFLNKFIKSSVLNTGPKHARRQLQKTKTKRPRVKRTVKVRRSRKLSNEPRYNVGERRPTLLFLFFSFASSFPFPTRRVLPSSRRGTRWSSISTPPGLPIPISFPIPVPVAISIPVAVTVPITHPTAFRPDRRHLSHSLVTMIHTRSTPASTTLVSLPIVPLRRGWPLKPCCKARRSTRRRSG